MWNRVSLNGWARGARSSFAPRVALTGFYCYKILSLLEIIDRLVHRLVRFALVGGACLTIAPKWRSSWARPDAQLRTLSARMRIRLRVVVADLALRMLRAFNATVVHDKLACLRRMAGCATPPTRWRNRPPLNLYSTWTIQRQATTLAAL